MTIQLDNSFILNLPPEAAWALLNDIERIAPCVPGARLTEVVDEDYSGTVKVKLGPITAEYKGTATITSRDAAAKKLTLTGKGREIRGQGMAGADLVMQIVPEGTDSRVTVATALQISGKVAQLGKAVMQDVSARLIDQFVANLKALTPAAEAAPAPVVATPEAPRQIDAPEAQAVDLVQLGGASLLSRDRLVGAWMVAVLVLLVILVLK